ncbi:MAG: hypothetical protein FJX84_05715, partial [Bacteroidetes bacterium]|nr:hypothetical protein [Bacteroidota bacterium]
MRKILFDTIFLLFSSQFILFGQNIIDSKSLDKLFWKGKYKEIEQDYYILYLQNFNDPEICFKYGTSLLFEADSLQNLIKANNLLLFSASQKTSKAEYHFFCGRAYHARSVFDSALVQFELYKSKRDRKTIELPVEQYIKYCLNGQTLPKIAIGSLERQNKEISIDQIGIAYNLPQIMLNGEFINYNTELTKIDIKKGNKPVRYVSDFQTKYFASYGDKDEGDKDIYMIERSYGGKKIVRLPDFINSTEDEDFPHYDAETNFLYFSSKGHNSIGGFDIFRVSYDTIFKTFGDVENLGLGISTPFDDYLFIYNSKVNKALLTTGYLGKTNTYAIFRGNIDIPNKQGKDNQEVFITFKNDFNSSIKLTEIEVIDQNSEKIVGKFKVDDNGKTQFSLPPGKYTYMLSIYGTVDDFTTSISIPNGNIPITQEITYQLDEKNNEKISITQIDTATYEFIARILTKEDNRNELFSKSSKIQDTSDNVIENYTENEALTNLNLTGLTKNEVVEKISDRIIEIEVAQKDNDQLMSNLNVVIANKSTYFDELQKEIESIENKLSELPEIEKFEKLNYLKNLIAEQQDVLNQNLWMQNLNDSLHALNLESNPEKRKFDQIIELGDLIRDLSLQNKNDEAYIKIIQKNEQIQSLVVNSVYEKIYSNVYENELEQARIEKKLLSLSGEHEILIEELKNVDLEINNSSLKEKNQLEIKKEAIQQKINSNQKKTNAYQKDLQELREKIIELESKRNLISILTKEASDEIIGYDDAKKKYLSESITNQTKIDSIEDLIKKSYDKLSLSEIRYLSANESYLKEKDKLDENSSDEQLIQIEQELLTNIEKLLSEENSESVSEVFENYLQEKIQESKARINSLYESEIITSSSASNEENLTENSNSNSTENQSSRSQNEKENQASSSSASNQENEQNLTENSNSNSTENQSSRSQNVKENQASSSSTSNQENEQNLTENSTINPTENQSSRSQNEKENQASSSSASNQENEQNLTENSNSN